MKSNSAQSVSLLLLSGGVGQRSRHSEPKQFYELAGHPIIAHSLIAAAQTARISEIIVNAPLGFEERTVQIMQSYCRNIPFRIVAAGRTRQESCKILVENATHETVIVHEAARPFVSASTFNELLAVRDANAGYCLEIPFSMCEVDVGNRRMLKGVSREHVVNIQLPQKFATSSLIEAHNKAKQAGREFTEDAIMLIEMSGQNVAVLPGSPSNLKITTNEDFLIAEQIIHRAEK